MNDFMKDRYGVDDLTSALGVAGMVAALVGSIFNLRALSWIGLALILVALARAFSKNLDARRHENELYRKFVAGLPVIGQGTVGAGRASAGTRRTSGSARRTSADLDRAKRTAQKMWTNRKTTMYFKCRTCGQILSVPRGKGKIRVTCPKCGTKVEKKS